MVKAKKAKVRPSTEQIKQITTMAETTVLNGAQIAREVGVTPNVANYYIAKLRKKKEEPASRMVAKLSGSKNERQQALDSLMAEIRFLKSENDFLKRYINDEIKK
jgi:hypothetical protein